MSIKTRWNPPVRHWDTAALPFMAVFQRTRSRRMNCSSSLRLITLSSTMRTFIGGTVPSRRPAVAGRGGGGGSAAEFGLDVALLGIFEVEAFLERFLREYFCWDG